MLLGEQLLQEKKHLEDIKRQKDIRNEEKLRKLAKKVFEKGIKGLTNKVKEGSFLYSTGIEHKSGDDVIQNIENHLKATPYIAEMAIEEGIDFTYNTMNEPCYDFKIVEYSDYYMVKAFKECKKLKTLKDYEKLIISELIDIESAKKYFDYEATIFSKLKESPTMDSIELPHEKKDYRIYSDAIENAMYRLGLDEFEPTYSKYCKPDYTILPIFQKVHNCTEISHRINKKKRIQKQQQAEKGPQFQKK